MTTTHIQLPVTKAFPKGRATRVQAGATVIDKSALTINSVPVSQTGVFRWGYTSGVAPQKVTITTSNLYAQEIVTQVNAAKGKVTINMSGRNVFGGGISDSFQGLSMMPRKPSKHTHDKITIVDDRWRWPNKNVYNTYNLVRKANDLFVFKDVTVAVQPTLHEAKNYYVDWTINPDTKLPWTALEIVKDILTNSLGYAEDDIIQTFNPTSQYIPGNIVLVGDQAHSVISRFMALADVSLYIDKNGKVVIYKNRTRFGQAEFDRNIANSIAGKVSGDMWVVDRKAIRPTNIFVSAEREFELLLTYNEHDEASVSGSDSPTNNQLQAFKQVKNQQVFIENVTTTVIDRQVGNLPLGTIVTIRDALTAFGKKYGDKGVTLQEFRENYGVTGSAVFSSVLQNPKKNTEFDPQAIAAWSAIMRDYRTKFRVPQSSLKFMKSLKNVLVDIVNPESGKRAPSQVFSQISWVVNVSARNVSNRTQGITLDSFKELKKGSKFQPVPMVISNIDMDFGTFVVSSVGDVNQPGSVTDIIRGVPKEDTFFNDQFAEGETELGRNSLYGNHGLKGDWEMSAIVSCVLLPQGNETMFWTKTERPSAVKEGKGPSLEIHSSYDTARFALSNPGLRSYRGGRGFDFVNSDVISALHKQEGARRWVTFSDQTEGDIGFAASEAALNLRPIGPIDSIKYSFNVSTGGFEIGLSAVPVSQGRNIRNIVGEDLLEAIFKQVKFDTSVGTR